MFPAVRGAGAYLGAQRLAVSGTSQLGHAILATGFPYDIREGKETNLPEFSAFCMKAQAVRRLGSAILDGAYVAAGRFDGFWELALGPWDMAPTILLVTEAGGVVTTVRGGTFSLDGPGILATNGKIHGAMLETPEGVRRP